MESDFSRRQHRISGNLEDHEMAYEIGCRSFEPVPLITTVRVHGVRRDLAADPQV